MYKSEKIALVFFLKKISSTSNLRKGEAAPKMTNIDHTLYYKN